VTAIVVSIQPGSYVMSNLLTSFRAYATLSAVEIMNKTTHFAQLQGLLLGALLAGLPVPARRA
jgi:site-specific recombinase